MACKLIETWTPKEGTPSTVEKSFSDKKALIRALDAGAIVNHVKYELIKYGEAFIDYDDGRVLIKVIDDGPKLIIHPDEAT